jgi:signal transduction histidine kinase
VHEAADLIRPLANAAGVQIDVRAEEATFVGDGGRLLQTLQNLLANAIKFSPAGSTVRLESVVSGGSVQFTVADSGRGIPQDQLESIFESFQQVNSSDTRDPGGSGLGLGLAIVERHHGRILAESDEGKGSTFRVELSLGGPAG